MNIRWKKIAPPLAIAAVIMFSGPTTLQAIGRTVHQYRVRQAGGVWCSLVNPDGSVKFLYGLKACHMELTNGTNIYTE
jgi:hypothetical protein